MVRPQVAGADSSINDPSAARRDTTGFDCRLPPLPARLATRRSRASRGRTRWSRSGIATARRLRTARGGVGAGGARAACERVRAAMARPALFHRADRLGTFDTAAKPKGARLHTFAVEPGFAFR